MSEANENTSASEEVLSNYADSETDLTWNENDFGMQADPKSEEAGEESEETDEGEEGEVPSGEEEQEDVSTEEGEEEGIEEEAVDWEGITQTLQNEKTNLNKALHSEREKRKEQTVQIQQLELNLQTANDSQYKEQLESVIEQLKKHALEDVIKIDKPKALDPRITKLLAEQEQNTQAQSAANTVNEMQGEVQAQLASFPKLDATSNEQGTILAQMILAAVNNGADMSEAVSSSMTTLSSLLDNTTKVAKKNRKPAVVPKTKPAKSATQTKRRTSPEKKAIAEGDFKGLFERMGKEMSGS